MATSFADRVYVVTATTGTGSSIALGTALSAAFFTAAEALVDGRLYTYIIEQGADFEIQVGQAFTASGAILARGTPDSSKIGGTAGTSQINLNGTATVRIIASAAELNALIKGTAGTEGQAAVWSAGGLLIGATRGSTFSVHKNGTAQTGVASTVDTRVTWSTEISDTEGIFASNAFTPTDGSVWLCECAIQVSVGAVDGAFNRMRLYRNGSSFVVLTSKTDAVGGNTTLFATFVIFGNGQTHEIYVDLDGTGDKTLSGAESSTKWNGVRLF